MRVNQKSAISLALVSRVFGIIYRPTCGIGFKSTFLTKTERNLTKCLNPSPIFSTTSSSQQRSSAPLITSAYEARLYEYIGGIMKGTGGISLGINGAEDHVHVLANLRPDRALSDVLRDLKMQRERLDA
jgi:hypothetical protein